ncbi:MAG: acyl-CoA thioesterase [Opitutales bacterium]
MADAPPPDWLFTTRLTIRVSDLNYGGHLANDRVLGLFHEIRVRWFATEGWSERDIGGVGVVQTEAEVSYRSQGHLGEVLCGGLRPTELKSRGFTLAYRLWVEDSGREIARGSTTLRFFDYPRQTLAHTPKTFAQRIGPLLEGP